MYAMVLKEPRTTLEWLELPDPVPGPGQVRIRVAACGVCRTDLHVIDGELPDPQLPIIPGHQIVGLIDALGINVDTLKVGQRVGVPWLAHTCGHCGYCQCASENLCDKPLFTGYTRDGGFATAAVADARFTLPLPNEGTDESLAPLLCAGLIGWRALRLAGGGRHIGLYGFGASAHILAQVLRWQGRKFCAFTRPGDTRTQAFASATVTGHPETKAKLVGVTGTNAKTSVTSIVASLGRALGWNTASIIQCLGGKVSIRTQR